ILLQRFQFFDEDGRKQLGTGGQYLPELNEDSAALLQRIAESNGEIPVAFPVACIADGAGKSISYSDFKYLAQTLLAAPPMPEPLNDEFLAGDAFSPFPEFNWIEQFEKQVEQHRNQQHAADPDDGTRVCNRKSDAFS